MAGDWQTTINSAEVYKEALKGQAKQSQPAKSPPSLPLPKRIPKTSFIIDGFKYASSFSICYFLTHFHSDHYEGLTPKWSKGIIFCSPITAQLLIDILNLPKQFIHPLPLSQRLLIDDAEVILLDANHCPGAVQFLFKIPNRSGFQKYVHTGDFRYCHQMKSVSLLNEFSGADAIFLDTTYCHPKFQFPSQDESIDYVVDVINRISFENEGNVLFLVATYIVGKERILVEIARRCKRKVYVDSKKMAILRVLGLGEGGMFSEDMSECDVHVVGWNVLGETWPYFRPNFVKTREIMEEGKYSKVVGFVPTGWTYEVKRKTFDVRSKDSIEIHLVPYSEHSNYEELREYVKFLKPKSIIPTVGVDVDKYDSKHANAMRKHFAGLLDEMAIKHEFLLGFKRISRGENESVECLEASDTIMQEHEKNLSNMNSQNDVEEENVPQFQCASQESSSQDLSEISMNETIQELTDCLPSWVTRHQMIGLLKDSGRNVVEAVSNFYEHETEFHAVASASTSSNFVNPVTLLDKDCVDPKASLGKDGPPCKLTEYESASPSNQNVLELAPGSHVPTLSQTCKLSSVGNLKRDAISPGKRKKSTLMNKQSKKSSTKLNLEKQHTITKFFTKMAPLGSKENNETAMPKESEMYKEVVDKFIQVVNGDNTLRSHALTFIEEAKGDLDVALDLYYTRLGVEDTEKENCSETIELLPSQRNQRVSHSGQDMEVAKREEPDTDVSLLDHASDRLGLSYVSLPPERYSPVEDACWKDGQAAPYIHLARTFDLVEDEKGKIKATSILCNMFRSLLVLSPSDVLPAVYLCLNKIAPDHENMELNIGSSTVVAALEEACGTNKSRIRELYNSLGDLGDVAQLCRQSQSLLVAPAPLTIRGVYDILRKISVQTGSRSTTRKKNIIVNLMCSCREKEMKFLVRTLVRNLRIGAMTRTVLPALAQAIAMNSCSSERIENIKTLSAAVVEAYNIIPDLNILIPMLLEKGTLFSSEALLMVPGVPIKPMLAKIANGASQILKTFENKAFTCEYKYDGQRAQIHRLADGTVHVFSRNGDKTTSRFPDLVNTIKELCDPAAETFILDAEVVAIDRKNGGNLKSFQELSSRERGNKDSLISIDNIKVLY
ncbi:DNA ligase [Lithospermum erythrorhizon]|uniref:DNA ligase n=1 Tax=Lithospermum erythrorhizon TaxID=34254 RepID=A0AAV3QKU5_LITER